MVKFNQRQVWTQNTELFVISCTFDSCSATNGELGGAIHFVKQSSTLTIHGTIFNKREAADGGGIFACAEKKETNGESDGTKDIMTHTPMTRFNSQYCCYSFCTAIINSQNEKTAGYGSAVLVSATDINLNYSSTFQCPSKNKYLEDGSAPSYGAQFDLKTTNIDSCNINATSGYSRACSAIEYRDATTGTFQFQTVVDQKGGFITSFTRLQGDVQISECNFINNTVKFKDFNPTLCAVIHVRMKTVTIENFCFFDITFEGFEDRLGDRRIASKGNDKDYVFSVIVNNCQFDNKLKNDQQTLFNGLTTSDNSFPEEMKTKEINQLKLGYCEGEQKPPPTFETSYFSKSEDFSKSDEFTKSDLFSYSSQFSPSRRFTDSDDFLRTMRFTASKSFTPSNKFTGSKGFSPSTAFTFSKVFSNSLDFTASFNFTASLNFKEPANPNQGGGKKTQPAAIIGGVIGGVAGIALIAFLIAYFVKKSRIPNLGSEEIETMTDSSGLVENKNPLYNKAEDDPFKEDFENDIQ